RTTWAATPTIPRASATTSTAPVTETTMPDVTYEVVEHDGGWAYKVGDVFSETYPTHRDAHEAAASAARRQQLAGETDVIQYEDARGKWHTEVAAGGDRPRTDVEDEAGRRLRRFHGLTRPEGPARAARTA